MRLEFSLQERNRVCSCRNARTRRSSAETGIIDSPRPAGSPLPSLCANQSMSAGDWAYYHGLFGVTSMVRR